MFSLPGGQPPERGPAQASGVVPPHVEVVHQLQRLLAELVEVLVSDLLLSEAGLQNAHSPWVRGVAGDWEGSDLPNVHSMAAFCCQLVAPGKPASLEASTGSELPLGLCGQCLVSNPHAPLASTSGQSAARH